MPEDGMVMGVPGLGELDKTLDKLPFALKRTVEPDALRAGGKVIRGIAKAKAPIGNPSDYWSKFAKTQHKPGSLRRAITLTVKRPRRILDQTEAYIFVRPGGYDNIRAAYYAHMVERGHKVTRKTGKMIRGKRKMKPEYKTIGRVAAKPFMKPAADTGGSQAFQAAVAEARKKLPEAARKALG